MKQNLFLLLFICFLSFVSIGQQPSHYIIGEDELAGIDVYSILQDREGNVWITTENGLMQYDGYSFIPYSIDKIVSRSLFGLTMDNDGLIYCHSINGRIYRLEDNSLELYYSVPDSLVSNYMFMDFDNRNHLIISCKSYLDLSPERELKVLPLYSGAREYPIYEDGKGGLGLADVNEKKIYSYYDGKLKFWFELKSPLKENLLWLQFTSNKNKLLGAVAPSSEMYWVSKDTIEPVVFKDFSVSGERFNATLDDYSRIWLASATNGVQVFNVDGRSVFGANVLFPKHRISAFMQDRDGGIWLPTLGKGIIVIPSFDILNVSDNNELEELNLLSLTKDSKENVYVGSQEGYLYQIRSNKHSRLKKSVELLMTYTTKIGKLTYLSEEATFLLKPDNFELNSSSAKGVFSANERMKKGPDQGWLSPDRYGVVYRHTKSGNFIDYEISSFPFKWDTNRVYGRISVGRTYAVHWDSNTQKIWAATSTGLKTIGQQGVETLTVDGNHIYSTEIIGKDEFVWVASRNQGLLVYKNGELIERLTTNEGLLSNQIHDLKLEGDIIYLSSSEGLQMYDLISKSFRSLTKFNGLNSNHVIDFEVTEKEVWILGPKGLQCLPKSFFLKEMSLPPVHFTSIIVNDEIEVLNQTKELEHDQNKLSFYFATNSFSHRGELIYQYQLSGVNDDWVSVPFSDNNVEFNALSPGDYTFQLRTQNKEGQYSDTIVYHFIIALPYWETWWFYTLVVLFVLFVFYIIFQLRMRIVKKQLILERQLKISEIKAIKAQMNPHFVFNALNSVQDLVMMEDVRSSNSYLTKFADLMRKTLELSSEQFIALDEELEMLELYLQLEKLRFGNDFDFTFDLNLKHHPSHYKIPAMLLQPYVENAIKHGLLHKTGEKKVILHFHDIKDGFQCEIIDNGVGRAKSAEINKRRTFGHQSFSQSANESRIDLINQTLNHKIEYEVEDLMENGESLGTKVSFIFKDKISK
jgi:hypothetical protein